jgi:hypothetical protein
MEYSLFHPGFEILNQSPRARLAISSTVLDALEFRYPMLRGPYAIMTVFGAVPSCASSSANRIFLTNRVRTGRILMQYRRRDPVAAVSAGTDGQGGIRFFEKSTTGGAP